MAENFTPRKELLKRYRDAFASAWADRANERSTRRYLSTEADFLPASLAVSERPTPILPHVSLWVICCFVVLALIWSVVGRIDIVVVASGKVLSGGKTKTIVPIESQIVRRVHVADGSPVKEGDVLIEFDAMSSQADMTRYSRDVLRGRAMALAYTTLLSSLASSERPNKEAMTFTGEGGDLPLAISIVSARWAEFQAKYDRANADLARRRSDQDVLMVTEKLTVERSVQQRQIERDFHEMLRESAVPRHSWIEQDAKLKELEGEIGRIKAQKQQVELSVLEAEAALTLVLASERGAWRDRLDEAERDIHVASAELQKARYRSETNVLAAPVSGRVQQLAVLAPGSVATAGQIAMAIVPDAEVEEVEVLIENRDIGFVNVGQKAELKFETFDYTRFGTVPAVISYISPDAIADEQGALRYQTKLRLQQATITNGGRTVQITPGMTVVADIKSGNRSIISYFLSPIMKTVSEAVRER